MSPAKHIQKLIEESIENLSPEVAAAGLYPARQVLRDEMGQDARFLCPEHNVA